MLQGVAIMRRRRLWYTVLGILLFVIALLVLAAWPGSSTFTVSPETTYITEPLDKHGYVDYVTALNQRIGKGITPEANANVLIWQAIGPRPEGGTMPPEYFQWLGIEAPPEEGEYFVDMRHYLQQRAKADDGMERQAKSEQELEVPYEPWMAEDKPELAGWLERNKQPMALIGEA